MVISNKTIKKIVYYLSSVVIYGVAIGLIDFIDKRSDIFKNHNELAGILLITICVFIAIFIAQLSDCKYKFDPIITFVNPLAFFLVIYIMLSFDEGYKYNAFNAFFTNGFVYIAFAILLVSFVFSFRKLKVKNIKNKLMHQRH